MAQAAVRVLVVDGGRSGAGAAAALLEGQADILIERVDRLAAALRRLDRADIDAVLLDLAAGPLPEYGAIDRLQARRPDLAVIALAATAAAHDAALIRRAIRYGAQDVLPCQLADATLLRHAIIGAIERKRLERHRLRYAREDETTGLANRTLLEERFARAVARAARHDRLLGLVAIELTQPAGLADERRHRLGDRLLRATAARLARLSRTTDTLARTRSRGFTWLVEDLDQPDEINGLVDRLGELLEPRFRLDQGEIRLSVSAGVALYPLHGSRFAELHAIAEAAMSDVASISGTGYLVAPLPFPLGARRHASAA